MSDTLDTLPRIYYNNVVFISNKFLERAENELEFYSRLQI